jgi:hypothetical protein
MVAPVSPRAVITAHTPKKVKASIKIRIIVFAGVRDDAD